MNRLLLRLFFLFVFAIFAAAILPHKAYASHAWGNYHWARMSNPFTLKVGDNVSASWDSYLDTTIADWSFSSVLDLVKVAGNGSRNCSATTGRVEACNKKYGNNGWLGVAQIWASGDHITKGTVKMNDTYFNTAKYNTPAWRNLVMCQEVGHTLGLDHQDEAFGNPNLGTCMDYTNDPSTNQHPNFHDYEELEIIYAHTDSYTTVSQTIAQMAQSYGDAASENPGDWGRLVRTNGKVAVFEKDFGGGNKLFTFVIFAE